jgi:hypothetical protein
MDNVQNYDSYVNIQSSQTYRCLHNQRVTCLDISFSLGPKFFLTTALVALRQRSLCRISTVVERNGKVFPLLN